MNSREEAALEQMRSTSFSQQPDNQFKINDAMLLRYLRARDFDVTQAIDMLNNTLKWRLDFGLQGMLTDWMATIRKENETGKLYVRGFDKDGSCLLYMKPRFENTHNHEGNVRHLVYTMEKCIASMERRNHNGQDKVTLLIDFDGYNLFDAPAIHTSMETLSILQNHYPERLLCAHCLRAPWAFYGFWTIISPFCSAVTQSKVNMVLDANIKQVLLEKIDAKVLESSLGGDDTRPFSSSLYLNSSFDKDMYTILEERRRV